MNEDMSEFPDVDRSAMRLVVMLPADRGGYHAFYTNDFYAARDMLVDIEQEARSISRELLSERPFVAMLTTNETLPVTTIVFIPIDDMTVSPKFVPLVGDSSLYEVSKPDVLNNMVAFSTKYNYSLYKTKDVDKFIDKINIHVEQMLTDVVVDE
jgi:hypothetical protein